MTTETKTREERAVALITAIDHALQTDDWLTIDRSLIELKGVSPCLYRNVLRTLRPLFGDLSYWYD